jgi:hypothetical protein
VGRIGRYRRDAKELLELLEVALLLPIHPTQNVAAVS